VTSPAIRIALPRSVAILANGSAIGARALLLLAPQKVPAQFGGQSGILIGTAHCAFMPSTRKMTAMSFGTLIGHRRRLRQSRALRK